MQCLVQKCTATADAGCRRVLQGMFRQAVLADLNTMAHDVARLSPHYCCDRQRFRTLGLSEAEWCDCNRWLLCMTEPVVTFLLVYV